MEQNPFIENKINFKLERDFSGLMNATFAFVKAEFKPLFKILIIRFLPLILIIGVLTALSNYEQLASAQLTNSSNPFDNNLAQFSNIYFLLNLFFMIVFFTYLQCIVFLYIKHYNNKDEMLPNEYIKANLMNYIFPIVGINILVGILVGLGTLFLIIPGIYLYVATSLAASAFVMEDIGIYDAITRSVRLIKRYWWVSFAGLLVIGILYGLIGFVFNIPLYILLFISVFNGSALEDFLSSGSITIDIIINTFSTLGYFATSLMYIYLVLNYYNLVERKEAGSLIDSINEIDDEYNVGDDGNVEQSDKNA